MGLLHKLVFNRNAISAVLEGLALYGILAVALWSMFNAELSARIVVQGLFFISFGSALLCALRLRRSPAHRLRREGMVAVILGAVYSATMLAVVAMMLAKSTASATPRVAVLPPIGEIMLLVGSGSAFIVTRTGIYLIAAWNRLRRQRLLWSLTNAHILVVVLVAALYIGIGAYSLLTSTTFYRVVANEQAKLTLSEAARLVVGLLLLLSLLSLFLLIATLIVIPPSALFSFLVMRTTIKRLQMLTAATQAVRSHNYAARVEVHGEDEVARLQADFNAMTAELEKAIRDLQTERDTVTQLLDVRRDLTANVSHDLRTPIASLRASLESAIEHQTPPSAHDLEVMQQDVLHLQNMVDDLFTISRVELGQLTLRCQPTDVREVIARVVESTAPYAWRSRRIEIVQQMPASLPLAHADGTRLEQILRNLIYNGLRHTPSGGVVTVSASPDTELEPYIAVEVWDTGEGIAAEDLPHIWERFYKVGQDSESEDRLGLGLAIVKELTEAMQGSVSVNSTPGMGSRFIVRLPLADLNNNR
ncbi:MAG TPA: HAMP domain-containing sensor histidine kinase [Aggregatilineales bacterium]|nr:HAMP domain-containing sensor histidine kinase [Aggregatilineales bacterium]